MITKIKTTKFIILGNNYDYIIAYFWGLVYNIKLDIKNIIYSKTL
jgi:hypothetical protein